MREEKPKVLMLGWEFPPVINGGLGVACHDLCIAMSEYAKVTMILPKSNPEFKVENLHLIGLNNFDAHTLKNINHVKEYSNLENVHFINSDLNPYYNAGLNDNSGGYIKSKYINKVDIDGETFNVFHIDDLYGGDVIDKVRTFGKLAARIASTLDFDVIHAHDWMTMIAGMEIKTQTGKPLVMHIHSLEVDRGGKDSKGWVYQMEKRGMEYADVLMPVSNFTGEIISRHYHIDKKKIFPVHNGIRPVKPYKSEKPFDEKVVLFVGRLTRQKGPDFFLQIAARVLEKIPDVRFIMAGQGDSFNNIVDKSALKEMGNRFHVTGFLNMDKVHYLLSIADVYCMPSVSEPFGLSAVEAAQFGIPVVISKQSGVAEVLQGSIKFDYWKIDHAADSISALLNDQVLREKVVEDANKDLTNISWENSAKKVMEGYEKYELLDA
ncbi:MAG TPA: glycosyltransferase family 4 protein [Bacteroidia bacterium]|nr:glycosyltransferase family 4 protein [Bacteroidia bacterium]